jgi:hypothetical protein
MVPHWSRGQGVSLAGKAASKACREAQSHWATQHQGGLHSPGERPDVSHQSLRAAKVLREMQAQNCYHNAGHQTAPCPAQLLPAL